MFGTRVGPKLRQYAIVTTVNFSMLWAGIACGWTSPVLVRLANATETVLDAPLSDNDGSWIMSSLFLASTFACLVSSLLLDNLGRKYSIILSSLPQIIGSLIMVFAHQVWLLILARSFVGVSLAWAFSVSPTYVAEIASKEIRGSLGTILHVTCCTGFTVMLAIGPFVPYLALNIMYATTIGLTTIPMLFLPDSPYYLYSKGRIDEAKKILITVRGSEYLANQEIAEYEASQSDTKIAKRCLLKDFIFLKTLALVFIFAVFTQITGANTVELYLQTILTSIETNVSSRTASVVIGFIKLAGGVLTAFFTDRFGRKPILIWSYFGMAVGMIGFGSFFNMSEETKQLCFIINYIPLLCLILIVFCNSTGQGSLFYAMTPELFEGPSRAIGISVGFFTASIFTFLVTKYFVAILSMAGPAVAYWTFGVVCILAAVFVMLCLPETKKKTFAEIQGILGRKL